MVTKTLRMSSGDTDNIFAVVGASQFGELYGPFDATSQVRQRHQGSGAGNGSLLLLSHMDST